jgi:F-type H+-transporting ATPase subunit b
MFNRVISCLMAAAVSAATVSSACASAAAPAGELDLNPMAPSAWKLDLAIWTAAVFLCLFAVLWKFAWRPLADGLDKREQNIADQIAQAQATNEKAREILATYDQKLAAAQDQVRAILDEGRREAERIGQEMIDKSKEEAKAEYQHAVTQIEAATNVAIKELAGQSATLAIELAGKIVGVTLKPADHARLIDQAVSGFVRGKN